MKTRLFFGAAMLYIIILIVGCSKEPVDILSDFFDEIYDPPITYYRLVKQVHYFPSSPLNSTVYVYDSNNKFRLDKIILNNSNGGSITEYEYNTSGQLIARIQGNTTYRYSYNNGLITSSITEIDGILSSSWEYFYNSSNQMIIKIKDDDCKYNYNYDNRGNVIREIDNCQGDTILYEYDYMRNPDQLIYQYAYDRIVPSGQNNLTRFEYVGEFDSTFEYVYNSEGYPIERIQFPNEIRTTYEYVTFED
jgi:YD repeat-containing protein